MIVETSETKSSLRKGFIGFQDSYLSSIMNPRTTRNHTGPLRRMGEAKKFEYRRTHSQGHSRRIFSIRSLLLLIGLSVCLLILPLILPPLPPPPFMLLLLPIGILAVLMILAFRPATATTTTSRASDMTHTSYM